ncbi:MAG: hypothetical protein U0235_28970 [Polyangiaceae bacterium]
MTSAVTVVIRDHARPPSTSLGRDRVRLALAPQLATKTARADAVSAELGGGVGKASASLPSSSFAYAKLVDASLSVTRSRSPRPDA